MWGGGAWEAESVALQCTRPCSGLLSTQLQQKITQSHTLVLQLYRTAHALTATVLHCHCAVIHPQHSGQRC